MIQCICGATASEQCRCFNASRFNSQCTIRAFFDAALYAALTVHGSKQRQRDRVHEAVQRALDGRVLSSLRLIVQSATIKSFLCAEHIELIQVALAASPNRRIFQTAV
jgi:hypothetical protein